jgi:uncharacterized Ntn-hydrolase superfamily protein
VTFSLVACDLEARQWGVAVASKFLAVGAVVPWVRGDVGAIATQSAANVAFGPDGLRLLEGRMAAQSVLDWLLAGDEGRQQRQVGIVDREGRSATFTGSACFDWAGGRTGACYAAQGNILAGAEVVDALAESFEGSRGALAERLLAALQAGDDAGGDRRGRQSAALAVRQTGGGYGGNNDILIDLRVDDHPDPVPELRRLHSEHQLLFGQTPEDKLLPLEGELEGELRTLLERRGFPPGEAGVEGALRDWAGVENLEERLHPGRVDPAVLQRLRER